MNAPRRLRFDLSQMGEADKHNLAATFCEAVKKFYESPENRKRFEDWQRERQAHKTVTA